VKREKRKKEEKKKEKKSGESEKILRGLSPRKIIWRVCL